MKPLFILGVSLAANVALAVVLISRRSSPPSSGSPAIAAATSSTTVPHAALTTETWAALCDGDDRDVVARLRAEGFPPSLVRALAVMKLNERFAARRKALSGNTKIPPYWRSYSAEPVGAPDTETRGKRRALENEYAAELKGLLGDDAPAVSYEDYRRKRGDFDGLPPDKVRQVMAINQDYDELGVAVREQMRGIVFPEDQAKLDLLEREKRADLLRTLTPEELESYDLRASETARGVRYQLAVFDPSESEFRALVKVQQAYEERSKGLNLTGDESREMREAMVAEVLTPERFTDYQTKTSGSYPEVSALAAQLKLPPDTTGEVIGIQRDISRRAIGVRNDPTLTSDQRDAQLALLAREGTARLETSLGQYGLGLYRQTNASGWLRRLPPPSPGEVKP